MDGREAIMVTLRGMRGLVAACHPLPTAAVTVFVTAVALAAGRPVDGCVLVASAVLTGQLSVGWCNDAVDAVRDASAGRRGKPVVAGVVTRRTVAVAAGVAAAACVPLSLANGVTAGGVHLAGVAAAWAYDLGVKRTPLSWLPYAVGFGALPPFVTLGLPDASWPAWWGVGAAALLGVGAHLANVVPDIDTDLRAGVRGLPQRLGSRRTRLLLPGPLLAAVLLATLGPPGALTAADAAILTAAVALTTASALAPKHLAFRAAMAVAATAVAAFILHAPDL